MKRIYLFIVPLLALLSGCEGDEGPRKGAIWDIPYPRANFVILDAEGNNIFKYDPEAIYDLEVEYKDKVYRYDEDTRALPCEPFGIRSHFGYPYMFTLGDFDHDEEGSYIVRFRDQEWLVEYKYDLRWKHYKPIKDSYIKIGSKEVTAIVVDKYDTFGDGTLSDIYAIPLHYAPEVKEWDIPYPTASYAILDGESNNIFQSNPESMNDVVITYSGETYRYEGETRALLQESLALTTDHIYPYRLNFGDFDHNDKGSYVIKFGEKTWAVEFEYTLEWVDDEPVLGSSLKVDGEEAEMQVIEEQWKIDDYNSITVYAIPLHLE